MIKDKKSDFLNNQNKIIEKNSVKNNQLNMNNKIDPNLKRPINTNDTFFEKFDKTKKDHKEKIRKLKRKNETISGILTSFDKKLKSNQYVAKVYGIIGFVSAVFISFGVVLFVLLLGFFNGVPSNLPDEIKIAENFYKFLKDIQFNTQGEIYQPILQTAVILSMTAVGLIFTPIIYMISSWFVGINNIHQEKKFVIAYWSIISISGFLLIVSLALLLALGWGPFGPFVYPSQPIS